MGTAALFDEKASTYDDFCRTPLGHFVDVVEREIVAVTAKPKQGEKVIDLGCGTGSYTYWLSDLGLSVVGVDISQKMLEVARNKREKVVTFVQADLLNLPFDNNTFDLAVCNTVLEFLQDPVAALREGLRVLKPGGRLVVGFINSSGTWAKKYSERGRKDPGSVFRHARFFSVDEVSTMLPFRPSEVRFGLYVGPDEFQDFGSAMQLERECDGQQQGAGYFVVRWDKTEP
ncbi:class I SAM-dependent methyltransferase [Alicyclobacillus macrosporangiidus]|uniref:Methyltransferase domain-containing protein n=1 Tax=Alicyclobacillus macrosporangiidus TaxID=392015 RepID=A0A1I7LL60_9BACL|nr:class I SAM-dependent methyltransferase [Alicyclobacillus macrosporangiidus]SFV10369.1 Methyltransferase domain-containing protein [Alicyclobacillus macrosporangiidus]